MAIDDDLPLIPAYTRQIAGRLARQNHPTGPVKHLEVVDVGGRIRARPLGHGRGEARRLDQRPRHGEQVLTPPGPEGEREGSAGTDRGKHDTFVHDVIIRGQAVRLPGSPHNVLGHRRHGMATEISVAEAAGRIAIPPAPAGTACPRGQRAHPRLSSTTYRSRIICATLPRRPAGESGAQPRDGLRAPAAPLGSCRPGRRAPDAGETPSDSAPRRANSCLLMAADRPQRTRLPRGTGDAGSGATPQRGTGGTTVSGDRSGRRSRRESAVRIAMSGVRVAECAGHRG